MRVLLLALGMALLSACATQTVNTKAAPASPEEQVERLAKERWEAILAKEYKKAYEYLSPGYQAKVVFEVYNKRFGGKTRWKDYSVKSVQCEEEVCTVDVEAGFTFLGVPPFPAYDGVQQFAENWIKVDGQWYHRPKK